MQLQTNFTRILSRIYCNKYTISYRSNVQLASVDTNIERVRPYSEVPGPQPVPVFGNAWRFLPGIGTLQNHHFVNWMKHMYENYGVISKLTNIPGKRDLIFLFDPKDFETVFRNEGQWPIRPVHDSFPYYRNVTRKEFYQGVGGILSKDGEEWQKFRTFVNPVLMQHRNAIMHINRIDEVTNDFIVSIPSMLDEKNEFKGNFLKDVQKWAFESIALIALDTRLGCLNPNLEANSETSKMIQSANEFFELNYALDSGFPLWKFISTPSWRRFVSALDFFTEVCMKYIAKAKEDIKKSKKYGNEMSVLQTLLTSDPDSRKAVVMAIDMMLAGIDTTSYTASMILYHLAKNPEKQERLYEELRLALPERDSKITADILETLKYLKACIKENNRITPCISATGRCLPVDVVLSNYNIPKNTDVLMCHQVISNMEQHFPNASSFIPERWIKNRECPVQKHHPFTMLPFGHGKRNCVGMRFALLELQIFIARIIRNYRLEWHHHDMKYYSGVLFKPIDPLKFHVSAR